MTLQINAIREPIDGFVFYYSKDVHERFTPVPAVPPGFVPDEKFNEAYRKAFERQHAVAATFRLCDMILQGEYTDHRYTNLLILAQSHPEFDPMALIEYTRTVAATKGNESIAHVPTPMDVLPPLPMHSYSKSSPQYLWATLTPKHNNPGYVYVAKAPDGLYKIGCSKDPEDRIATFKIILPFRVEYTAKIKTLDMRQLEAKYHRHYTSCRVDGEWFALTKQDIADLQATARMSVQQAQ